MSINRYRLRHRAREGSTGARAAEQLLKQPDRLIGMILVCNNFVNSAAAAIVTVISLSVGGEASAAIGVGIFTVVLIIFGEVAPEDLRRAVPGAARAARRAGLPGPAQDPVPDRLGHQPARERRAAAARHLAEKASTTSLSREELRTVVAEASTVIPHRHQRMLMSILDLERINVEDIMVPRNEIAGLDVSDDWDDILAQLRDSRHTRLPVYEGSVDELVGILHMKQVARLLARGELDREQLVTLVRAREPYYVPEGTSLNTQLAQLPAAAAAHGLRRGRVRRRAGTRHARGPARGDRRRIHLRHELDAQGRAPRARRHVHRQRRRRACAR